MCNLRMDHLSLPVTYTYGVLSIFASIFASFGNIVVLKILWLPSQKFKSNKILTSLAISDLSVGLILLPLFFVELLHMELLFNCTFDYVREYITTVTIGSSLLALGIVSYDRYVMMTEIGKYQDIMNKRKIAIMITLSWLIPAVSPSLRILGKGPFLYFVILLTLGPLIVLMFTYYKIMQCIKKSSSRISAYTDAEKKQSSTKSKKDNALVSTNKTKVEKEKKHSEKKSIKLAKTVSLLILVYGFCLVPSSIWSICDLINEETNFTEPWVIQNMYVFACFAGSMNSCINPIIYFFKQPGMKKEFLKMFGISQNDQQQENSKTDESHN